MGTFKFQLCTADVDTPLMKVETIPSFILLRNIRLVPNCYIRALSPDFPCHKLTKSPDPSPAPSAIKLDALNKTLQYLLPPISF